MNDQHIRNNFGNFVATIFNMTFKHEHNDKQFF